MLLCIASSLLHNRLDGFLFDKDISSYDPYTIISSCTLSIYSWSYMSKHLLSVSRSDWYLASSPCELLLSTTRSYSAYIFSSTSFTTTYSSQLIIHVSSCHVVDIHPCITFVSAGSVLPGSLRSIDANTLPPSCVILDHDSVLEIHVSISDPLLKAHATYHSRSVSIGTSIDRR